MLRITNIKMPVKHNINDLKAVVCKLYKILKSEILSFEIAGQAIDARNKNNVIYVYSVDVELVNEKKYEGIKNVREIEKKIYKIEVLENIKTCCGWNWAFWSFCWIDFGRSWVEANNY